MRRFSQLSPLCFYGHVASYAELLEQHHGQESAILPFRMGYGVVAHPRFDVYACSHLSRIELAAALCGGRVDCVSVLAAEGLLNEADSDELHLRLARGDSKAAARRHEYAPTSHMHWSRLRTAMPTVDETMAAARRGAPLTRLSVPLREAVRQAMTTCLSYAQSAELVAALVDTGVCPVEDVAHAILVAPRRVERALRELGAIPAQVDLALAALRSGHHF